MNDLHEILKNLQDITADIISKKADGDFMWERENFSGTPYHGGRSTRDGYKYCDICDNYRHWRWQQVLKLAVRL